jgi:hypothetical protein
VKIPLQEKIAELEARIVVLEKAARLDMSADQRQAERDSFWRTIHSLDNKWWWDRVFKWMK